MLWLKLFSIAGPALALAMMLPTAVTRRHNSRLRKQRLAPFRQVSKEILTPKLVSFRRES